MKFTLNLANGIKEMNYDVFNGDADGICALHQLRLATPLDAELVTGVKRDIALLQRINGNAGDQVTVLDVSLDKNRDPLLRLLDQGVRISYFDHHMAGDIPQHPLLTAMIDTGPDVCTSLLVNRFLDGRFLAWAVVAAFGDNLGDSARRAARPMGLAPERIEQLKLLGECLNYNGYGETLDDLFFHPADLYRIVHAYADPFDFIHDDPAFPTLRDGYLQDMEHADAERPLVETEGGAVFQLPAAPWARRVSGAFGNQLATRFPQRAHAVLTPRTEGGFVVSVRAPIVARSGADELCRQFPTGGGRKGAAGINHLPDHQVDHFVESFARHFTRKGE